MKNLKKETGSSIVTIILLLIIVIILGAIFYLRSNNLIHIEGTPWNQGQKSNNSNVQNEREPYFNVKEAVDDLKNSSNR